MPRALSLFFHFFCMCTSKKIKQAIDRRAQSRVDQKKKEKKRDQGEKRGHQARDVVRRGLVGRRVRLSLVPPAITVAHAKGTSPMSATARDRAAAATRPCLLQKTPSPSMCMRGTLLQPATWHALWSRLSMRKSRSVASVGVARRRGAGTQMADCKALRCGLRAGQCIVAGPCGDRATSDMGTHPDWPSQAMRGMGTVTRSGGRAPALVLHGPLPAQPLLCPTDVAR